MGASPFRIDAFSGLTPRTGARLLPQNGATEAVNLLLTSGEIRPLRPIKHVETLPGAGPWVAVFRAESGGVEKWMSWEKDVDMARAPLSEDVEQRYYWTGDGEPRYATFSGLPSTFWAVGIPNPQSAPTVTPSGGSGAAVSRLYAYTFFSALGEESGPSPVSPVVSGKVDDTWAVAGMDAFPSNGTSCTMAYASGETTADCGGSKHWLRVGDEVTISGHDLIVSSVPSPTSFKVPGNVSGSSWARKAPWNTSGMKRRLYRSAGTNATFQLVHDDVGTTYNDTLTDAQILGDEMVSLTWEPPPAGLKGIGFLPSGAAYGFVGSQLRFSEPYQPHAWPPEYGYSTDYEIIGLNSFGTVVVAATAANPYVFDGVEPSSVTPEKIDKVWPCLSKRSVVSVGDGVLYATAYGIAFVGSGGPNIWTSALYTIEEWAPLNPASMVFAVADGRVFAAYKPSNGATSMLVFHPGEQAVLTEMAVSSTELYTDPRNGLLYIVNGSGVNLWNAADGELMVYAWRSKDFELGEPANYGAAKVDFVSAASPADKANAQANFNADVAANVSAIASGSIAHDYGDFDFNGIEINWDSLLVPRTNDLDKLTFTLFVDGVERFSRTVVDSAAFRLPSGYLSDNVSVQVSGTVRVQAIKLATTMIGLKQV